MIPTYFRKKLINILFEKNKKLLEEKEKAAGYRNV
jgi:hypothetical protein